MAADSGGTTRRFGLLYVALNVVAAGLWVLAHFGSEVLAGAGLWGERGMLKVTSCVDRTYTTDRGGSGSTHHCFGTFTPDGGGKEVTGVEVRGGSGDTYLKSPSCKGLSKPWWCGGENSDTVRARYVHGDAWIWGGGVVLPTGVALMGVAAVGAGLLIASRTLKEPRPGWLAIVPKVLWGLVVFGFLLTMLAMVMES
ncbi:hypothetical protein ACWGB8_19585 [Kitasatospora sp. NPDC054939]